MLGPRNTRKIPVSIETKERLQNAAIVATLVVALAAEVLIQVQGVLGKRAE